MYRNGHQQNHQRVYRVIRCEALRATRQEDLSRSSARSSANLSAPIVQRSSNLWEIPLCGINTQLTISNQRNQRPLSQWLPITIVPRRYGFSLSDVSFRSHWRRPLADWILPWMESALIIGNCGNKAGPSTARLSRGKISIWRTFSSADASAFTSRVYQIRIRDKKAWTERLFAWTSIGSTMSRASPRRTEWLGHFRSHWKTGMCMCGAA